MLNQREINISGEKFVLQQFQTTKALKYGVAVGKIVGAVLAGGFAGDLPEDDQGDLLDDLDVSKMIEALISNLHEDRTPALIKSMLRDSLSLYTYNGELLTEWNEVWFETRFAGKLGDLMQLLTAIFEDNYGEAIEVAKKKFRARGGGTHEKSSDSSAPENGGSPREDPESPTSFFDPSVPDTARS